MDVLLSHGATLAIGLALGRFGHFLQARRSKSERAIADAAELWDRCSEIANARVQYVLAYHRRAANAKQLKVTHVDLQGRYRWADPGVILKGTPEWDTYYAAERAALEDDEMPHAARIEAVATQGYRLLDSIAKRRMDARK